MHEDVLMYEDVFMHKNASEHNIRTSDRITQVAKSSRCVVFSHVFIQRGKPYHFNI